MTGPVLWVARSKNVFAPLRVTMTEPAGLRYDDCWGRPLPDGLVLDSLKPGECRAYRLVPVEGEP